MSKITVESHECPPTVCSLQNIPVGTAFIGDINGHKSLFLKTYLGTVCMNDPNATWKSPSLSVAKDFHEVDIHISITTLELSEKE